MEEVKKEEQTTIETLFLGYELRVASYGFRPTTQNRQQVTRNNNQKKHLYRRKRLYREESKKEYTGDALALRGDERRDKLR
ncbi:hypothetical protein FQZ97_1236070 [compost metagenome]